MPKVGQPIRRPQPRERSLIELSPGSRFSIPKLGITGTLLKVNECRAHVRVDGGTKEVTIKTANGDERTFRASKSHEDDWGPTTLVVPITTKESETMPSVPTISADVAAAVADKPAKKVKATKETKAAKKTPAKAESNGKAKKDGLRAPQERILKTLLKHDGLTRTQLAAKAKVDGACCTEYIGSAKDDIRLKNDKRKFPSLITLGLVKRVPNDGDGAEVFTLTAKGKAAAAKVE